MIIRSLTRGREGCIWGLALVWPSDISSPPDLIVSFLFSFLHHRLQDSFEEISTFTTPVKDRIHLNPYTRQYYYTFFWISATAGNLNTSASSYNPRRRVPEGLPRAFRNFQSLLKSHTPRIILLRIPTRRIIPSYLNTTPQP